MNSRSVTGSQFRSMLPGLVMTVLIAAIVLPPIWTLLRTSLFGDSGGGVLSLQYYGQLILQPKLPSMLLNSILFAAFGTVISLILGGSLAWLVERTDTPLKGVAYFTTITSMGTPYILYVTAWLFLLGRSGPLNDIYRLATGSMDSLFNVNSLVGMILIEGMLWSPLVFLMLSATFRVANAEMEEAARMSGASVLETVRLVSLRLAAPAILAVTLFVFIHNLEALEVPAMVGMPGKVDVLTTEIYRAIEGTQPALGYVSAFSMAMLLIVSILLHFYTRISRHAERFASITGKGYRPRPFQLGRFRFAAGGVIALNCLVVLVLPLVAVLWMAASPFERPMRIAALHSLTARNFIRVLTSPVYAGIAWNTLIVAGGAATVVVVLTGIAGWLSARRWRFGQALDQFVTVPLVFPGLVLGVALLELALRSPVPVYGTLWLIGFACVILCMPFGMRYAYTGVLQIHSELEQAGRVAGATLPQVLRRVVLPLLLPALATAWLFIFLTVVKDMSTPLILAGSGTETIAVSMFELWSTGQVGEAAALGILWSAAMSIVAAILQRLLRQQTASTFGV